MTMRLSTISPTRYFSKMSVVLNHRIIRLNSSSSYSAPTDNKKVMYSSAAVSALINPKPSALQYIIQTDPTKQMSALVNPKHVIQSEVQKVLIPDVMLDEYVWAGVPNWSNKIAMECALTGRNFTYGQCRLMTRRFASALIKNGLKPGDIVALVLPNVPEFPIAFLGANAAGLACTLINPQYTPDEITRQMMDCDVNAIVTISLLTPVVKAAASKLKHLKSIIVIGDAEEGCQTFKEMMRDDGSAYPQVRLLKNPREDIVALPYSSGTSGKPKGVMLTHRNMIANIRSCIHPDWCSFRQTTKEYQEVFIAVLPFFHILSLNAILMGGLSLGAKIVCLPNFEPTTFIKSLADYKPTFLHMVPRLVDYVATNEDIKPEYLERVHNVVCGGAPAGRKSVERLLDRMMPNESKYQEGYGMTETSPVISMLKTKYDKKKLGSCGSLVPMTEALVIDIETKVSLGPNQIGELYCRGPQVMKGYWRNLEATRDTMDGDWLKTGDIAYYDDDMHFHIVDRIKELIKVKGYQVSPTEIEELLKEIPGVIDAAVIGIPDETAGEVPRAYIVQRNSDISAKDIHDYLTSKAAPYKQLRGGVHFIDAIPRNPSGKILRKELRASVMSSLNL